MTEYVPCPKCGNSDVKRVGYTWWGGALGPRMLNHVKCNACGTTYNGKTGGSNTTGIIIYSIAVLVLSAICLVLFYVALGSLQ